MCSKKVSINLSVRAAANTPYLKNSNKNDIMNKINYRKDLQTLMDLQQENHSEYMALASMILGIIAIVTSGCIYLAIICGSLAIILALLSRGGRMDFCTQAKAGLISGVVGLILTIIIYVTAFAFILQQYGGIDGLMQEYMNLYNADTLDELYDKIGIY